MTDPHALTGITINTLAHEAYRAEREGREHAARELRNAVRHLRPVLDQKLNERSASEA